MENKEQLISILTKVRDGYVRILEDGEYRPEVHGKYYESGICYAILAFTSSGKAIDQLKKRIYSYLPFGKDFICPRVGNLWVPIADRVNPRIELIDKIIQDLQ